MKQKKSKKKDMKKAKIIFRKDSRNTCINASCFEPFPDGRMGYCTIFKKIIATDTHGCEDLEEK